MPDLMHDWLFTPSKGDGSGPLRAGPHYRNIWEGHGGAGDKGAQAEVERKTAKCQLSMGGVEENRSGWGGGKACMMKRWRMKGEWRGEAVKSAILTIILVILGEKSKERGRWGWKLQLCTADLRWKQSEESGEREEKTRETKTDEERWREWAVANDTTFGVTTPDKNNKHTKTKHKPWTSKQFNWKCWVLQVCGWLGLLAMIYPPLNSAPDSFSFCLHHCEF